ncbi:MAG: Peptidase U62 family protein [Candidatus Roizmanbacteria bacterium GW2011_GWA2_37_7]|uniref:Peptidase U62 family protein n=1 Tax=Candidatus Roizmanbacteria bacterium GW2011_GWA2_37_7 TaxID=1618481 RepID=A0A0G0H1T5_9BACT|nr:MAG: Peptidase U62 family protein [Candidatus Roizmanbacteria bacterium GW2011_GWA2_37_7]
MLGEQKLKQIADKVLCLSKADQTEVLLSVSGNALTRFANNEIHQNMAWKNLGISIRVVTDKKIGVASTNSFEESALQCVIAKATTLAKLQKPDPSFVSLPLPCTIPEVKNDIHHATEDEMAEGARTIIEKAKKEKLKAFGAYANDVSELAVANSLGVWAYHAGSSCNLSTIVMGENSSGFASDVARSPDAVDAKKVAETAVSKTLESTNPQDIEPGEYEVILEPQAVSEMMAFFQWYGPNARIYHEGASPLSDKMNTQVFGKNITLIDDPFHSDVFPMPFDFEGHPKAKITFVKNGVLKNIAYDSYYAMKFHKKNTGHALPAPNTMGPIPLHLYIAPGNKAREEMIQNVKRGLLVTRLWYVRVLNPKVLNVTGMTRDGTFLIENGKIVRPVKNLRFNQSIPEALNNIAGIENKLTPLASFEGEMISLAPTLHIKKWEFSSRTLF